MGSFWHSLGEAVTPVVLALVTYIVAQFSGLLEKNKNKPHKPLEILHRLDMEIKLVLERARDQLNAKRVYLSQYMNGDKYLSETEIVKKSRTHEVVAPGVSPQQESFRGVVISDIPEETDLVMREGPSFTVVSSIPYGRFRWLCEQGGVTSIARCAIRGKKKEIVGFVGADFDGTQEPKNIDLLCHTAFEAEQLLEQKA